MTKLLSALFLLLLLLGLPAPVGAEEPASEIRIGVAAINGKEDVLRSWGPLVAELEAALPGKKFSILPFTYDEIEALLKEDRVQFVLLGPTFYVDLEIRHGISRLATLVRATPSGPLSSLGGVVAVRADRKELARPLDLKGKKIAGTGEMTIGGCLAALHEFKALGIGKDDFKQVAFLDTYEKALLSALEGRADAAFVRTGTIEKLIKDGRIAASEVRVLRFASAPIGFPQEISTRSYPEWAFAKTLHTPDLLAKQIALALLSLPANSRLRKTADVDGFTVPLDYGPVHDLLRVQQMGPYAVAHDNSLIAVIQLHRAWVAGGALSFLLLSGAVVGMAAFNRRLVQSRLQTLRMRDDLEHIVAERTRDLEAEVERRRQVEKDRQQESQKIKESLVKTVKAVAITVEMRDPYMSGHQQRVANLASAIGEEMKLAPDVVECIYLSALVHDIGMIYVPSEITNRPGPLSDLEYEIVKNHPRIGHEIMASVDLPWPIADVVLNHHRRLDGKGYPVDVEGEIPLEARVLGVADVVEAMCSHRPYRPPLGLDKALEEIRAGKGSKYDPDVVDACLRVIGEKGPAIWS